MRSARAGRDLTTTTKTQTFLLHGNDNDDDLYLIGVVCNKKSDLYFLPFLLGLEISEKVSRPRKNIKKCLEIGENNKINFADLKPQLEVERKICQNFLTYMFKADSKDFFVGYGIKM